MASDLRVLFITTRTNETDGHVGGWDCWNKTPAKRITFDHMAARNDGLILTAAEEIRPDVIFYIGACRAPGTPMHSTFRTLREIAPTVHLCSDAADLPWHLVLDQFARAECFDLQVAIDGGKSAPVDLATLTPVDLRFYDDDWPERDIRCGFSGTYCHTWRKMIPRSRRAYDALLDARSKVVVPLSLGGLVTAVRRRGKRTYAEHVQFLKRCKMVLNTSFTGSGRARQVKGRVLEAGWVGCALLEDAGSPAGDWFPEDCLVRYRDADDAALIIKEMSEQEIAGYAERLAMHTRAHYHPARIYGEILDRINVGHTVTIEAA